jgi:hypothetical protein
MTEATNKYIYRYIIYCIINSVAYYMFRPTLVAICRKKFLKNVLKITSIYKFK